MARLFPFRSETSTTEGEPRVVDLEGEDADEVFSALSSTTARQIYARLDAEPGTPSDVAEAIDSSIQNVRYHLENLEGAGLVEVVDTWYSSRGNEMSVYATTDGPLIVTSDESSAQRLKTALSRLIGGIGALAGGSLLVQYGLTRWIGGAESDPGTTESGPAAGDDESTDAGDDTGDANDGSTAADDDADDAGDGGEIDEEPDAPSTEDADLDEESAPSDDPAAGDGGDPLEYAGDAAEASESILETVPPGLLFFLGGLVVLLAVTAYWYWYRPRRAY